MSIILMSYRGIFLSSLNLEIKKLPGTKFCLEKILLKEKFPELYSAINKSSVIIEYAISLSCISDKFIMQKSAEIFTTFNNLVDQ